MKLETPARLPFLEGGGEMGALMRATDWASEGPGKGAEFTLRLPLAPEDGKTSAAPLFETAMLPPKRILVVDDNRDAADSLGMLLRFLGADV
jgi:hypothetical protein